MAKWIVWEEVLLLTLTACFWGAYLQRQTSLVGFGYSRDFLGIYVGARAAATAHGAELYNLSVQRALMDDAIVPYSRPKLMPFIYPAYVALMFRPLGSLPYGTALLAWLSINCATAVWTATRLLCLFGSNLPERLAILGGFFAWVPLQLTLLQGQLGVVATLAIVEAWVELRAGHEWRAGWWLSLGLLKPQLILFPLLVFLIWRCWRTIAAFSLVLAGILGISSAALGFWIPTYVSFLKQCNRLGAEVSLYPEAMQNWRGLVCSILKTDRTATSQSTVLLLTMISVLAVCFICYSRYSPRSIGPESRFLIAPDTEARYATAVLLGVLSSPHLYMHDWVVALPAVFALWFFARELLAKDRSKTPQALALLLLLGFAPMVFFAAQFIGSIVWPPIQFVPVYVAVITGVAILTLGPFKTPAKPTD